MKNRAALLFSNAAFINLPTMYALNYGKRYENRHFNAVPRDVFRDAGKYHRQGAKIG